MDDNLVIRNGHLWKIEEVHTSHSWDEWTCLLCGVQSETIELCKSGINPVLQQDIIHMESLLRRLERDKIPHMASQREAADAITRIEEQESLLKRTIEVLEESKKHGP